MDGVAPPDPFDVRRTWHTWSIRRKLGSGLDFSLSSMFLPHKLGTWKIEASFFHVPLSTIVKHGQFTPI